MLSLQDFLCCRTVQRLVPACLVRAGRPGTVWQPSCADVPVGPSVLGCAWRRVLVLHPRGDSTPQRQAGAPPKLLLFSRFSGKFYPPTSNPSRQLPKGESRPAAGKEWEERAPRASLPAKRLLCEPKGLQGEGPGDPCAHCHPYGFPSAPCTEAPQPGQGCAAGWPTACWHWGSLAGRRAH